MHDLHKKLSVRDQRNKKLRTVYTAFSVEPEHALSRTRNRVWAGIPVSYYLPVFREGLVLRTALLLDDSVTKTRHISRITAVP